MAIRKNAKRVLGLNERYLEFIRPNNLKKAIRIADDKVLTKKILKKKQIPVPDQLGVIANRRELEEFDFDNLPKSFVMKPVHGVRGGGVEIFYNKDKQGRWIQANGARVDLNFLKAKARDILDGRYSLFNEPDIVLIEERVKPHKVFKYYTYKGTPDIRIITYNNIPVMGMLRLPTRESEGKANLDQGAIGTGIDMAVGKTTSAIMGKAGKVEYIPEYKLPISGLRLPYWSRMLGYSIEASQASGLGFAAVDFLLDRDKGPLIIELNARPGLSIQLANDDGLKWRLRKASGIKVKTAEKGVRLAKDLFGGEIEEEIEALSGKDVIGLIENVVLIGKNKEEIKKKAKIDTGATITSIDEELARSLGYGDAVDYANKILKNVPMFESGKQAREYSKENNLEEQLTQHEDIVDTAIIKQSNGTSYRIQIELTIQLSGSQIKVKANLADRNNLLHSVLIGKRDLKRFLIDPSKK